MKKFLLILISFVICSFGETQVSYEIEEIPSYYTVKKGDNLSLIGKKFKTSVQELKTNNNLKSNIIHPGQKLLVKKSDQPSYKYSYTYYTVKKGDYLERISKKFGISVTKLKKMNNLKSSVIQPGQKLKVKAERIQELPPVEPTPIMNVSKKTYYKVKKGDTLESIANQFNIEKELLKQANLLSEEQLKNGEILVIPSQDIISEDVESDTEIETTTTTSSIWNFVVQEAFKFLNTPYRLGGSSKRGIDCSSLTKLVYGKIGITLPNTSFLQYKNGTSVSLADAKPGDLIFFKRGKKIGHVGIYLGENSFIHASTFLKKVTIGSLENSYYKNHFVGIRRYIWEEDVFFPKEEENVDQE